MGATDDPLRPIVTPRTLKGFRDLLPEMAGYRHDLVGSISESFGAFGFRPIETPALEYAEVLRGKGSSEQDREMFTFTDKGGREVGMRFDLTVPLARFVAQHLDRLALPLRVFHIAPVWRGEKPQRGRYREFVQCDADLIGSRSALADAEIVALFAGTLAGLGVAPFLVRLNDRRILSSLARRAGGPPGEVLRELDKAEKVGVESVCASLVELGVSTRAAEDLLAVTRPGSDEGETLDRLGAAVAGDDEGEAGVERLAEVRRLTAELGCSGDSVRVDPSIVRGLDYYTGVVFETTYTGAPEVGSVCSGGRYDNLTGVYSKRSVPGVGGSIGIDRLVAALVEVEGRGIPRRERLVVLGAGSGAHLSEVLAAAARLRSEGWQVDVHPEFASPGRHRQYADRSGAAAVGTVDDRGRVVKNLATGEQVEVVDDRVEAWGEALRGPAGVDGPLRG